MATKFGPTKAKVIAAALGAAVAQVVFFLGTAGVDVHGEVNTAIEGLKTYGDLLAGVIGAFAGGWLKTETVE